MCENSSTDLKLTEGRKKREKTLSNCMCQVSGVQCQLSHVSNANSHSHRSSLELFQDPKLALNIRGAGALGAEGIYPPPPFPLKKLLPQTKELRLDCKLGYI